MNSLGFSKSSGLYKALIQEVDKIVPFLMGIPAIVRSYETDRWARPPKVLNTLNV